MIQSYDNRIRSHQQVCDSFNNKCPNHELNFKLAVTITILHFLDNGALKNCVHTRCPKFD